MALGPRTSAQYVDDLCATFGLYVPAVFQFSETVEFQGCVTFLSFVRITRKAAKPGLFPAGPQTFGENLKQRRLELGLRQQDVAVRIGVSEWTVINWETGLRQSRLTYYAAIIQFLGCGGAGSVGQWH